MARKAAGIQLLDDESKILQEWLRRGKSEQRLVERARIVLLASQGKSNEQIAQDLKTRTARVSKWRRRFAAQRLAGLSDATRPGKPPRYKKEETDKRVLELLDRKPPKGYSQWNGELLARELGDVSSHQVWRILRRHDICLERRRSWCISTDPEFGPKAADVVGLYLNPPANALVLAWMRSLRFRLWNERRVIYGCRTARPSMDSATATLATAQQPFSRHSK